MAEQPRVLKHSVTGAVWVLPPCSAESDKAYADAGWVDAPKDTPAPDALGEQWAAADAAHDALTVAVDPDAQTKAELVDIAAGLGIDVPSSATKPEIAALIESAQTTNQEP